MGNTLADPAVVAIIAFLDIIVASGGPGDIPADIVACKARAAILAGTEEAVETTTLCRAVGPAEVADIRATGAFRNMGSAEGKCFTISGSSASSYAQQAVRAFGDEPYTTVTTIVLNRTLEGLTAVSVDGGVPRYVVPNESLPGLVPSIMNYSQSPIGP